MTRERLRALVVPLILLLALAIRLAVVFAAFYTTNTGTDDGSYYMTLAQQLYRLGLSPGGAAVAGTSSGPLYPVFLAPFLAWLPDPLTQIMAVRVGQAILDVATVYFLYRIAGTVFGERTALVALMIQALDPRYILQAALIATETLFMALFAAFMWVYVSTVNRQAPRRYFGAGLMLGLATLARPIPILFPVVLAVHAWAIRRSHPRAWAGFGAVTLGMALLVIPWSARNAYVTGGEFIPVSDVAASHLWIGTTEEGGDLGGESFDHEREEDLGESPNSVYASEDYTAGALQNILENPLPWLGRVGRSTIWALVQPYGTVVLGESGGPTFRGVVLDVLRGQAPISVIWQVPGFLGKLVIYLFHYTVMIGGVVGIVLSARQWRQVLPLVGWAAYNIAVVAPLLIEPRYIFPAMPYLMLLAASAIARERPRPVEG